MRSKSIGVLVALWMAAANVAVAQTASWADPALTVRQGLLLWLDAERLGQARKELGLPTIGDGDYVDHWPDASGQQRHCVQPGSEHQPKLVAVDESWVIRFDGEADWLRCVSVSGGSDNLTVFVVVAPHENPGNFRGVTAANAVQQRDYESGFNIDLGPGPTRQFEQINIEGRGFGGARDLHEASSPFGTLHTLEFVADSGKQQAQLMVDGKAGGLRPFAGNRISLDEWTVGARYFTNGPGEQQVRCPLKCDIAEVLVFDRVLAAEETKAVRSYLNAKHAKLAERLPAALQLEQPGTPLVMAENPPAIQMLVPGFRVRELPLELTNVNNVRYREDGKLITLGYNGDLHLLTDTDGDGLEDHAELFWKNEGSLRGPIGLQLTPEGYARGRGVFVPSKGKVSLIVDTDGDDRADEEIVVASGWQEIPQNVDAVGIAMDKDGALYFGLGTANYANAYLVDESGKAAYDIEGDRGTVQRVSPDFSQRETVCTGIRFPIAFAFNRHGDLFCTEQEGATWLPNGNPFDELLHIQSDRHYGFPPRHPRHNPGVIDEPSTFDYAPQHQSTCGMVFNESVNGGPVFGPDSWAGDAIVCGESRGKIWRTKLVKTPSGYVAGSQLLACLQMLTVDACVAPDGDLVVACHSGPPDWGTGPAGIGKLFRIESLDEPAATVARPVATWAESPNEIRIAFDRPVDPVTMQNLSKQVRVEYGEFVRAGDRFENLAPPYAVVQRQSMVARHALPVAGVSLTSDFRTMIISTAEMKGNLHYAVTIPTADVQPGADASAESAGPSGALPQHHQLDVDLALHGVYAEWRAEADSQTVLWSGWLPHLDLHVAQQLTAGSAQHDQLWQAMRQPGELTMTTRLDLHHILRPKIQPGSEIDYEWPAETVTFALKSALPLSVNTSAGNVQSSASSSEGHQTRITTSGDAEEPVDVEVRLVVGADADLSLAVAVSTNEDSRARPLPLNRMLMPWVEPGRSSVDDQGEDRQIAEIEGGSWGRGRRVFHSEAAGCFKCHAVGGVGATIGPDLANLVHRDYRSVLRDIVHPSFAINPDHISQIVVLRSGKVLTGVLRSDAGQLLLGDEKGQVTRISPEDIEEMKPSAVSVMPKGLTEKLTDEQRRDLMTFLLTKPPHMPLDSPLKAPPLRTRAGLAAVLAGAPEPPSTVRPLNVVLVAGQKDHGPGEHDYPAWQIQWAELLAAGAEVAVSMAWDFPEEQQMADADLLIFFQKGSWNDQRSRQMDAYFARGGGAVYIHWAVNGDDRAADFSKRIGLASKGGSISYRHGPLTLQVHNTDHSIMRNFDTLHLYDESYWRLTGAVENVTLFASSVEDGKAQPQVWGYEKDKGRVFVSIPGHYSWTFDDPLFRVLLLRGIAWAANEPVDRFNELAPLGARMAR